MKTENMISEGMTINQLEERLETACSLFTCCSEEVISCGIGIRIYITR